jgi:hypothetical protein
MDPESYPSNFAPQTETPSGKPYSTPMLTEFGAVADLTRTGVVSRAENGGHPEGKL